MVRTYLWELFVLLFGFDLLCLISVGVYLFIMVFVFTFCCVVV